MNPYHSKPIKVLLVDDDSSLLRSLSRVLSDHDLEVETATCAAEALVFLERFPFDAIVCDQNMPGISGLELLAQIRKERAELLTFILSGSVMDVPMAMDWAMEIGVDRVFAKPCDSNEVAESIKSVYGRRQAGS